MPDFTYHCLWYMRGSWTAQLVQVVHDGAGITLTFFDATLMRLEPSRPPGHFPLTNRPTNVGCSGPYRYGPGKDRYCQVRSLLTRCAYRMS